MSDLEGLQWNKVKQSYKLYKNMDIVSELSTRARLMSELLDAAPTDTDMSGSGIVENAVDQLESAGAVSKTAVYDDAGERVDALVALQPIDA